MDRVLIRALRYIREWISYMELCSIPRSSVLLYVRALEKGLYTEEGQGKKQYYDYIAEAPAIINACSVGHTIRIAG